jgi:hypothetical protein
MPSQKELLQLTYEELKQMLADGIISQEELNKVTDK